MVVYCLSLNRNIPTKGAKPEKNINFRHTSTSFQSRHDACSNIATPPQINKVNDTSSITFCVLFNPVNLLCRFFGELYSNIFLKSIVTPLVVLIKFWWVDVLTIGESILSPLHPYLISLVSFVPRVLKASIILEIMYDILRSFSFIKSLKYCSFSLVVRNDNSLSFFMF